MRSVVRRLVLLTVTVLAVMTLVAPAAQADHQYYGRRVSCGQFVPVWDIPVRNGTIVVYEDRCGRVTERFFPHRHRFFHDDFHDDFDRGPTFNVFIDF